VARDESKKFEVAPKLMSADTGSGRPGRVKRDKKRTSECDVGHGWVFGCKIDQHVSFLYFQVDDLEETFGTTRVLLTENRVTG